MPVTPDGIPELIERDKVKAALAVLGVTNRSGIYGFAATLHEVTFKVHLDARGGGKSSGRAEVTVPIVGATREGSNWDSDKWGDA